MDSLLIETTRDPVEWAIRSIRGDKRNKRYALYQRYLEGDHPLQFATPKYESAFGNLLEALAYDRTNMVIDAHADRMQVKGFNAKKEGVIAEAQAIWDDNHMDRRQGEIEAEGFGMGDAYIIVEKDMYLPGKIHIWPNDAANVRVKYSQEMPGKIEYAIKVWRTDDRYIRLNVYYPDRIEKFISATRSSGDIIISANGFKRFQLSDESWPVRLDVTDTVPVFHVANNARTGRYGVSELLHVLPMQDAINKTLTDLMVAMEFGAFPQKVILGAAELPPPNTPEGIEARKKENAFELGIDRLLTIVGDNARIAEFQAVALAQFIACAEFFDKAVSRVTRVPVHYLSMSSDFPSGESFRMAEVPFVAKIVDRQRGRGEVYGDAVRYALRLKGMEDPGEITPEWTDAATMSVEDELSIAQQRRDLGLPLEEVLRSLSGYDEADIKRIVASASVMAEQARRFINAGGLLTPLVDPEAEEAA